MALLELKASQWVLAPDCEGCDVDECYDMRLVSVIVEHGAPTVLLPTVLVYQCSGCDSVTIAALTGSVYA